MKNVRAGRAAVSLARHFLPPKFCKKGKCSFAKQDNMQRAAFSAVLFFAIRVRGERSENGETITHQQKVCRGSMLNYPRKSSHTITIVVGSLSALIYVFYNE